MVRALRSPQQYAPTPDNARPGVLRNARSAWAAQQIAGLRDEVGFSITDLAEALYCDRAHAWRLVNGGRATADEYAAALAVFGRRAA